MAACAEPIPEEPERPEPPAEYLELLKAKEADAVFSGVEASSTSSKVCFLDRAVAVPVSSFRIHDCTVSAPAEVTPAGEWWSVGGIVYAIKVERNLSRAESVPIYAYYDKITLYIYLSNSEILVFDSVAKKEQEELERRQHIPIVRITTSGGAEIKDKENYVRGTITIEDPEKLCSDVENFSASMGIRGRGNSTWGWRKKPWKVKLDSKASLLGMPADKEWCLLANYSDKTLLRNIVAMKLSEICGFSWTPKMESVEVYLNGKYQGVYNLCEHKKISKERVNIDIVGENDNEGEAVTGGYYLEMEESQDETTCWWTAMNVPMMFNTPEVPTPAQYNYMTGYIDDFEKALCSNDFADPQKGYAAYIDVASFINYYIVQELTKNVDGNLRKSSFITKERGKKMEMYHLWDFDLTLGNCGYFPWKVGNGPENFWIKNYSSKSIYGDGWFFRMFKDPAFVDALQKRWNALLPELKQVTAFIEEQALILDKAQRRNFDLWGINTVDPEMAWIKYTPKGSYSAEIKFLKEFYTSRLEWLDKEINKL